MEGIVNFGCLRYCKSTIFQANHNWGCKWPKSGHVVCDTAKVRFFKQITTWTSSSCPQGSCLRYCKSTIFQANHNFCIGLSAFTLLFAILQKYDFSSKSQLLGWLRDNSMVVCDTAKVRFFKQITTLPLGWISPRQLFAILQKYDFSSKSQPARGKPVLSVSCLRYCKSTIFQANHNLILIRYLVVVVVCDTAKVRFFKQITTGGDKQQQEEQLFAILQKYDFSSKSQPRQKTTHL